MSFSILEKVIYLMHELPFIIIFRFWIFYCFLFSGQNVCTNTRTIHQFADDKCSAFIDYVIDGFSLNKTKTFPGKSAQEINTLLTNPDPNLQCYFFKYVRQKRFNLCKGFVWKKKLIALKIHETHDYSACWKNTYTLTLSAEWTITNCIDFLNKLFNFLIQKKISILNNP